MEKLWLTQYQQGVPHEINSDDYSSLVDVFEQSCQQHDQLTAYLNMGHEMSYAQLNTLSLQFAIYLQSIGLSKGTRVAIMLPNVLQYPIALFGILRAGLIVVNTNPLYTPDEVTHQLNDAGVEAMIVLSNFAHVVEKSLPNILSLKHIIVTEMGDCFPWFKRHVVNIVVKTIKKMVPEFHLPNAISFRAVLEQGRQGQLIPVPLAHDDIAFIQYTGGTTGVAKGAILTHRNMVSNVLQASAWIIPTQFGSDDTIVTALPLYHIFSLTANCLTFFKLGAKNHLITNPRDMKRFINDIKHTQFTAITGVNTLFNALLNQAKFKTVDFSKLKLALAGGMALQKSVAERWHTLTGSLILEAYGLTETSPAVTMNPLNLTTYNGSIGLPLPSTEISIRDEHGIEVLLGEPGELCIKGPQVMPGYWQRPEETALVFYPDGYLRTGDIVKADEQGFIYLVDRSKDMILVSGFNVYPNEVEQVISQMPEVLEVGVIGVSFDGSGERVKACIVKREPSLTPEQVIAHCRKHLTGYKVPKIIEFYNEELPKTAVGKILRRALR